MKLNTRAIGSLFSNQLAEINNFNNGYIHWSEFPDLWRHMDKTLPQNFESIKIGNNQYGINISPHCIDVQRHDRSIQPHTDRIDAPTIFQLVVVQLSHVKDGKFFNCEPVFHYYDETGKKKQTALKVGDSVLFNPRKPHSMIYYGATYTVGMRSVTKKRK
jgi:hypothetical protein